MIVEEAIKYLQQFDPKQDLLVEATDGGLPFAIYKIVQSTWTEDSGEETPVTLIKVGQYLELQCKQPTGRLGPEFLVQVQAAPPILLKCWRTDVRL